MISSRDRDVLRRWAARKVEIAGSALNQERRDAWYRLDSGQGCRPMIIAEFEGVRDETRAWSDADLECEDPWARGVERTLRFEVYRHDVLQDDHVVEPWMNVNWQVSTSDFGVPVVKHSGDRDGHMGARRWDPPIQDFDRDFSKLKPRTFSVDRGLSLERVADLESALGDLLPVRMRGSFYWTLGLTWPAIELVGLESLMLLMYDNPEGLHRLMAFLRDDHLAFVEWLEREGLLSLNNENDPIGSGSFGYTRDLPQTGWTPGERVRSRDLWVLSESQETVGVGPDLFEEFVFPYQLSIMERFGKTYYGCCEPVHGRWHVLKKIPNLARVSVSPWADQAFMADALGRQYVFSRKPNPTLVSTGVFDEEAIREDLRQTMRVARNCRLEVIMKDVHTLNNEPGRLARWVQIAREELS
jgi:hypothetical protein